LGCGGVGIMFQAGLKKLAGFGEEIAKKIDDDLKKNVDDDGKPPPAFGKADFTVKAADIAGHFTDKHQEAQDKYRGKTAEITGKVLTVRYLESKRLSVELQGDAFNKIVASLQDADHAKAARLARGQEVKVIGAFKKHESSAVHLGTSGLA